jgi:hypothetical protein
VSVPHPVFTSEIGKIVVIRQILPDTRQVWASYDVPVTYRINRHGRRIVAFDPRWALTCYSLHHLRIL